MSPNDVLSARNRLATLTRHHGRQHPDTLKARAALTEAKLRRDIIAADDLDASQRARLAGLILGGAA
jgi:hypothetical protein